MSTHEGHCHCGAIVVWFETAKAEGELEVRACQCGFCTRHGAKSVTDPDGQLEFRAAPGSLTRYRFGSGTADFLICGECGVYVGAVTEGEGGAVGVLNVVGAGIEAFAGREARPVDYAAQTPEEKLARRFSAWTPVVVVEASPDA